MPGGRVWGWGGGWLRPWQMAGAGEEATGPGLSWDAAWKRRIIEWRMPWALKVLRESWGVTLLSAHTPQALWPLEPSLLRGPQIPDAQEPLMSYSGVSHGRVFRFLCPGKCTHSHQVGGLAPRKG